MAFRVQVLARRHGVVLILASPNYIFNVGAQMKAFMDRCCGVDIAAKIGVDSGDTGQSSY